MEMSSKRLAMIEATEKRMEEMQKNYQKLHDEKDKLTKDNEKLKCAVEQYSEKLKEFDKRDKEYEAEIISVKKELTEKQNELDLVLKDKHEAFNSPHDENDPGIPDISDPNRPTKLAEKYNELYDNQWTDAVEELLKVYSDEEDAIKKLLDVFKDCYEFCEKAEKQQLNSLKALLQNPLSAVTKQAWSSSSSTSKNTTRMLKNSRKLMAEDAVTDVTECYIQASRSMLENVDERFVNKCVALCWMMNVQDPPVVIGEECAVGSTFDGNIFREYTKSGTTVAYTVWLPLYLHKDGPLLCKGVAQPVTKMKKLTKIRDDPVYTTTHDKTDESKANTKPSAKFYYGTSPHSKAFVNRNYRTSNFGAYHSDKNWETKTIASPSYGYDTVYNQEKNGFDSASSRTQTPTSVDTASGDVVEYDPYGNPVSYTIVMRAGVEYACFNKKYYTLERFRRALNLSNTFTPKK